MSRLSGSCLLLTLSRVCCCAGAGSMSQFQSNTSRAFNQVACTSCDVLDVTTRARQFIPSPAEQIGHIGTVRSRQQRALRQQRAAKPCKAVVAPSTHTNGSAVGTAKPVLENPLWRDAFPAESQHSASNQLYRQPRHILPNRLRLFAGTANPVCFGALSLLMPNLWVQGMQ